jgi:hypothetical protein
MMDLGFIPLTQGHRHGIDYQVPTDQFIHGPAYNAPGKQIHHYRQKQPALPGIQVSNI